MSLYINKTYPENTHRLSVRKQLPADSFHCLISLISADYSSVSDKVYLIRLFCNKCFYFFYQFSLFSSLLWRSIRTDEDCFELF